MTLGEDGFTALLYAQVQERQCLMAGYGYSGGNIAPTVVGCKANLTAVIASCCNGAVIAFIGYGHILTTLRSHSVPKSAELLVARERPGERPTRDRRAAVVGDVDGSLEARTPIIGVGIGSCATASSATGGLSGCAGLVGVS